MENLVGFHYSLMQLSDTLHDPNMDPFYLDWGSQTHPIGGLNPRSLLSGEIH